MHKSRLSQALKVSLEDINGSSAVTEIEPAGPIAINDPDTAEAAMMDANDSDTEIREHEASMERLEEIATGLESICVELRASLEDGGLTPQAARMLNLAVESYTDPLGLEEACVPSVESFGGSTTRVAATQLSMESAREVIAKVWEAIKAIYAKVKTAIANFLKRVFDATERLAQRAEKLKAGAKAASGAPKSSSIELGNLASKLAINGRVSGNPIADFKRVEDISQGINDFTAEQSKVVMKAGAAVNGVLLATNDTIDAAIDGIRNTVISGGDKAFSESMQGSDGMSTYATPELPGGVKFYVTVGKFSLRSGTENTGKSVADGAKVTTLSLNDIEKVADIALAVADHSRTYKDVSGAVKDLSDTLRPSASSDELSDENAKRASSILRQFAQMTQDCAKIGARMVAYEVRTSLAYLALAEKSLAQYTGAPAAALPAA